MKRMWGILPAVLFLLASCAGCEEDTKSDLLPPDVQQEETWEKEQKEPIDTTEAPMDRTLGKRGDTLDFPEEPEWVNYGIPQGQHYNSLKSFEFFTGDTLEFRFLFDATAKYQTLDASNQADWNKLMGFSDCSSFHHNNSVRMVWRYSTGDSVEIGEYRYTNGKRDFSSIGSVAIGDTAFARITSEDGFYTMALNHKSLQMPRECSTSSGRYWLYPYFGGDETAPHDVNIHVQHLKPRVE